MYILQVYTVTKESTICCELLKTILSEDITHEDDVKTQREIESKISSTTQTGAIMVPCNLHPEYLL